MTNLIINALFEGNELNIAKARELIKLEDVMTSPEDVESSVFRLLLSTNVPEQFILDNFKKFNKYELILDEHITNEIVCKNLDAFSDILIEAAYNDSELITMTAGKFISYGLPDSTLNEVVWNALDHVARMHKSFEGAHINVQQTVIHSMGGNVPKDVFGTIYLGFKNIITPEPPEGYSYDILIDEFGPLHYLFTGEGEPEKFDYTEWMEAIPYLDNEDESYGMYLSLVRYNLQEKK